jgi:hypothetical protein
VWFSVPQSAIVHQHGFAIAQRLNPNSGKIVVPRMNEYNHIRPDLLIAGSVVYFAGMTSILGKMNKPGTIAAHYH